MAKKLKSVQIKEVSNACEKIQNLFFDWPSKEFSLNELCSILKISKTNGNMIIKQLVSENFLKLETIGKLYRISCNINHNYNNTRKILYHLKLIYESEIINSIYETVPNARTIIIFGSYRKGDDIETSDIDMGVEIIGYEEHKIKELGVIPKFGYRNNVPVNLHIFSRGNINPNLFANIANGIILQGFLEVKA